MRRALAALARVERAHLLQDARCLGTQILGAGLRAREARPVEYDRAHAPSGQVPGKRGAGGAAADDDDVRVCHDTARLRRWKTPM